MMRMQVRLGFVAVWIATTAAGMGISWLGVGDALRGTSLPTQEPAAKVPVHEGRPPASESAEPEVPSPRAVSAEAVPTPTAKSTRRPPDRPSAAPSASATPRPSAQNGRPSSPPGPEGRVRTYVVKSGSVVLALYDDSAKLVSASPNSGFQAKVWRQDEWLRVDLTDGVKGSAVFVTWNGHPPLVDVYEY